MNLFLKRNLKQIKIGGLPVLFNKTLKLFFLIRFIPQYLLAFAFVFIIRVIKPFYLIRFRGIYSSRIGHFAAETEQYLC